MANFQNVDRSNYLWRCPNKACDSAEELEFVSVESEQETKFMGKTSIHITYECLDCGVEVVHHTVYSLSDVNLMPEKEEHSGREDDCLQHYYPNEDITEGGL